MSFGGSEQTSQTQGQSQGQSNSYYDPTQTNLVNQYAQSVAAAGAPGGSLAYTPYTGQQLSFGDPSTLNSLMNYQAPTTSATTYNAANVAQTPAMTVTPQTLAGTDLSPYLNPYTSDVINTTDSQLSRQNNIDNATAAGQATAAGAFGGSRSAVLQNLNTDSYQRNLDATNAQLNNQNFVQAQGAATTDINNNLQGQLANQGTGLAIGEANQGAQNTAASQNAAASNAASLANQQAQEQAAQTQLAALGINSQQAEALFGANWAAYLNSQTDPQAVQAAITQAYGLVPTSPLSTAQQSSTNSSFGQGVSFKGGA